MSAVLALLGLGLAPGAWAYFTDTATAQSGQFSARAIPAPSNLQCVGRGNNSFLAWDAPVGQTPTAYRISYVTDDGVSGTAVAPVNPREYQPPIGGLFRNPTYTVTVVALFGTTTSPPTNEATIRARGALGQNFQC